MMYMPILIKRGNMNTFFCIMMFILGAFFGSFFTLAIYRIPLNKNITHERSFCPNCNHKLGAIDLIPVFSYIFLGGKCRYCKEKIRIRYFLLEILSGTVFVLIYLSYNMTYPFLNFFRTLNLISFILMYVILAIIAGIDKERMIIQKNVLMTGFCFNLLYNTYLYYGLNLHNVMTVNINIVFSIFSLAVYGVYLYFIGRRETIILGRQDVVESKLKENKKEIKKKIEAETEKRMKARYNIDVIMLLLFVLINTNEKITFGVVSGLLITKLFGKVFKKDNIPLGFFTCIFTVIMNLAYNYIFYFLRGI